MQKQEIDHLPAVLFRVLLLKITYLYKMINLYDKYQQIMYEPTEEEFKLQLKSFKPGQKLPSLNYRLNPKEYYIQLVYENYLDTLLEGQTLKLLAMRLLTPPCYSGDKDDDEDGECDEVYLIDYSGSRLTYIVSGIIDAIKHRGLNLSFEFDAESNILLRNYNKDYDTTSLIEGIDPYEYIVVGFKINGTKIECYDYSP